MRERRPTGAVSAMTQMVIRYDLGREVVDQISGGRRVGLGDCYRGFVKLMERGRVDRYRVFPAFNGSGVDRYLGLPVSILVMGDVGNGISVDVERRQRRAGLVGEWQGSAEPVVLYAEVPVGSMPTHEYRMRA